jgi:hypothetical protein
MWMWLWLAGCGVDASEWDGAACVDARGALSVTIEACSTSCREGVRVQCNHYVESTVWVYVTAEVPVGTGSCERSCEVVTAACAGDPVDLSAEPMVILDGVGYSHVPQVGDTGTEWREPLSRCAAD